MLLLAFMILFSQPDSSLLLSSRQLYFQFDDKDCPAEKLYDLIPESASAQYPKLLAYKGTALATSAECVFSPFTKLSRFKEGKAMIEQAIKSDPNNLEARFLRLSVQLSAPSFLDYNSDIETDRSLIVKGLTANPNSLSDADFTSKVIDYLIQKGNPTSSERENLLTLQGKTK